jgi:sodium-dependent dicarboxylate transporter 2/3/5
MGAISAIISMWISNTAATAMIFPIGLGILRTFEELENKSFKKLNIGMMLLIAYAASIGGIATPVGTPPNLIGIGMIEKLVGIRISFFQWMLFALPLTIVVFVLLYFLIILIHKPERKKLLGIKEYIAEKREQLGPWSSGEKNSLVAFLVAVILWVSPGVIALLFGSSSPQLKFYNLHIPESVAALVAISSLFFIPTNWKQRKFTLSWKEAVKIDWGTILLFGGGLSLGSLMFSTKLASALGETLLGLTQANSLWGITALSTALGIILSETTSNTASANMVIPIMIAISQAAGVNPLPPALGACLGASFGFMLPVSTPPNAIVYSSGMIPITKMIKTGIIFDILGFFAIFLGLRIILPILGF